MDWHNKTPGRRGGAGMATVWAAAACLLAVGARDVAAQSEPAAADRDLHYRIALAGVAIGETQLQVEIAETEYSVAYEAAFGVLAWSARGSGSVEGRVADGRLAPDTYRTAFFGRTDRTVGVDFAPDGTVVDYAVTPPFSPRLDGPRVTVDPGDLVTVVDPLTSLIVPALDEGAGPCAADLQVFNGISRFDLILMVDQVSDGHVRCAVRFSPISGHRAASEGVERLAAAEISLDMTRDPALSAWVPERLEVPTRLGTLLIERVDG